LELESHCFLLCSLILLSEFRIRSFGWWQFFNQFYLINALVRNAKIFFCRTIARFVTNDSILVFGIIKNCNTDAIDAFLSFFANLRDFFASAFKVIWNVFMFTGLAFFLEIKLHAKSIKGANRSLGLDFQ
jgi:hypothetical protein